MSDAITLTAAAIKKSLAPQAGSLVAAVSLTQIDWWSMLVAVSIAGVVALIAASDKFSEDHTEPTGRQWLTEFGIGAAAGVMVWFITDLSGWDYRAQLACIAASGWSGRWALDSGKSLIARVFPGGK